MQAPSMRLVVAAMVLAAGANASDRGAAAHADVLPAHRHKLTRGRRANGGAPAAGAASAQAGSSAAAAVDTTRLASQGAGLPPGYHARLSSGAVIGISIAVALGAVFALVASVVASTVVVRTVKQRRSRKETAEKKEMWVVDVPVRVRNTR